MHDLFFLLLKFGHFLSDELVKHLLFKPEWSNSEVKNSYLDGGLWRVMGVWKSSCHQELEFRIIGNTLVTQTKGTRFVNLFQKNWLKGWIKFFTDVFN